MGSYENIGAVRSSCENTGSNSGVYPHHNFGCAPECREYLNGRGCPGCPKAKEFKEGRTLTEQEIEKMIQKLSRDIQIQSNHLYGISLVREEYIIRLLQYLFDKLGIEKPDIRYKFNLSNIPTDTVHYSDGEGK